MKPAVILYKPIPEDLRQRLDEHFSVTAFDGLTDDNMQQHAQTLANAVGLIGADGKVDSALLDRMPALKAASTISVGYDNFDVQALSARGVLLMHTPTVLTDTVADTLMALVLATARRVVESAERVKAGEWQRSIDENWYGVNVHHKTLGVVGMGRIGMALAQRARRFRYECALLCAPSAPRGGKALRRPLLRSRYLAGAIGFRLPDPTVDGTDAPFNRRRQTGENEARRHPYQCGPRSGGG